MVFFDLDYKKEALVSDSKDMTFTFTLSGAGTGSTCFAYILYGGVPRVEVELSGIKI
jgi:hypothetical protein